METVHTATLCLDRELRITHFTPGACELIGLRADDAGQLLSVVQQRLAYTDLVDNARSVLATQQPVEREVHRTDGPHFWVDYRPIRAEEGVAITFINLTRLETTRHTAERRYARDIVETVWEPLLVLDRGLRVQAANPAFYETFQVEPDDTLGERVYDLGNGQWDLPELRTLFEEIVPNQTSITDFDVEHTFETIGRRVMRLNARRVNHKQLILVAIEDVTGHQVMMRELREERNFVDGVLDTVSALVAVLDEAGRIVRFNRECEEMTGYAFEEVRGENAFELLIPAEERQSVEALFFQYEGGHERIYHENHWITKAGDWRLIRWSNVVLKDDEEQVKYLIGTGLDITERRQLEREVISATDEERRRIGQELHDMLASHLAGTAMMAQAFAERMERGQPVTAQQMRRIVELLDDAGTQARSLSHSLMPLDVQGNELGAALRSLAAREQEMSGISCTFEADDDLPKWGGEAAAHLYRVVSEAVNNAVKHANAETISIRLQRAAGRLVLTVRDDGIGIGPAPDAGDGIGLHMMRYRTDLIGGRLDIDPLDEGGTVVRCSLPLDRLTTEFGA